MKKARLTIKAKVCVRCGSTLPLSRFQIGVGKGFDVDGFSYYCKDCDTSPRKGPIGRLEGDVDKHEYHQAGIQLHKSVRDRLRLLKKERGMTYDQILTVMMDKYLSIIINKGE